MSDQFVGEIRMFAGNYAPVDWATCDGQLMQISQNEMLYSLLGVIYGGDSVSNFNLPNLCGRLPVHRGQGTGLTNRVQGQAFGTETVTLTTAQMPQHNHLMQVLKTEATTPVPTNAFPSNPNVPNAKWFSPLPTKTTQIFQLPADTVGTQGGNAAHENRMPYQTMTFIIALNGEYPTQQ